MDLGTIKNRNANIKTIVNDFSILLNSRLQQFENNINTDNKISIETMQVLKELPIVKNLEKQLLEKNAEIDRLKTELSKLRSKPKVELQTNEIFDGDSNVSYAEISSLVTNEVQRLEAERAPKPPCNSTSWTPDTSFRGGFCSLAQEQSSRGGASFNAYSYLNMSDDDDEEDSDEDESEEDEENSDEEEDEDEESEEEDDEDDEDDKDDENDDKKDNNPPQEAAIQTVQEDSASSADITTEHETANNNKKEEQDESGSKEDEDEDIDVEEISLSGEVYYTNDKLNGKIYNRDSDGEVGDEVGHFEEGHAFFS